MCKSFSLKKKKKTSNTFLHVWCWILGISAVLFVLPEPLWGGRIRGLSKRQRVALFPSVPRWCVCHTQEDDMKNSIHRKLSDFFFSSQQQNNTYDQVLSHMEKC